MFRRGAQRTSATACSAARYKSSASLNDAKMNALVSLYHQSDRFITPETLSDAIDQAFTKQDNYPGDDDSRKHSFAEILSMRAQQRQAPKFSLGRDQLTYSALDSSHMGPGWIESKEKRVDRIYEALMGTTRDGKPSWTAIRENSQRVQAQVAADRERRG
ncbi:hypothetical protein BKA83DRAFT_4184267 [Pisolithus microcarpus]|nr:hypothetical protein BKA83DRAFT_4184267 [Pisolithus microcarpus]